MSVHRKIRVMQLINGFSLGGAEKLVFDLAARMDKDCLRVFVCAMVEQRDGLAAKIRTELEAQEVETLALKRSAHQGRVRGILELRRHLKDFRIDMLHTHCPSPDFYGKLAAPLARIPRVFSTVHSTQGYRAVIERLFAPPTTRYVAISETVRTYMVETLKIPPRKIVLIYNAIDLTRFTESQIDRQAKLRALGISPESPVITAVGRVTQQKGFICLVQAAAEVIQAFPDARFLIVGDDRIDSETACRVKEEIKVKELTDKVVLTGVRTDIPEILAITDVFVLPSLREGFSLALLEAMAAGLPVVATTVGITPEVVRDNNSGFIVPPSDPAALAWRIRELLQDPQKAHLMGTEACRSVQKRFGIARMVKGYEALYLQHWAGGI
jgi:glycosyltransferase involved in cell wall biosynthesis